MVDVDSCKEGDRFVYLLLCGMQRSFKFVSGTMSTITYRDWTFIVDKKLTEETYKEWNKLNSEIGSLLFHMINNPDKYL